MSSRTMPFKRLISCGNRNWSIPVPWTKNNLWYVFEVTSFDLINWLTSHFRCSMNAVAKMDPTTICLPVVSHHQVVARTVTASTHWTSTSMVVCQKSKKPSPMKHWLPKFRNGYYWVWMWVELNIPFVSIFFNFFFIFLQAVVLLMSIMLAIHYTNQRRRFNY